MWQSSGLARPVSRQRYMRRRRDSRPWSWIPMPSAAKQAPARIENYHGFPTGITGQALTARACVQAKKFGAELVIPLTVSRLACPDLGQPMTLGLSDGWPVQASAVVVSSGARYRNLALPDLEQLH